jgi:hypothetical protein
MNQHNRSSLSVIMMAAAKAQGPELEDEKVALQGVVIHLLEKVLTENQLREVFAPDGQLASNLGGGLCVEAARSILHSGATDQTIMDTQVQDWRVFEQNDECPEEHRTIYNLKVFHYPNTGQTCLDIIDPSNPGFGAQISIEINEGLPTLHCGNTIGGDNVMSVYFNKTEVAVVPNGDKERFEYADSARYLPNLPQQHNVVAINSSYWPDEEQSKAG